MNTAHVATIHTTTNFTTTYDRDNNLTLTLHAPNGAIVQLPLTPETAADISERLTNWVNSYDGPT